MQPSPADSNLESVLKNGSTEMFLWRVVRRVCPDATHNVTDWSHRSALSVSHFSPTCDGQRQIPHQAATVKSIYLHADECLFYHLLSAVMVQAVRRRTQRSQHVSICQTSQRYEPWPDKTIVRVLYALCWEAYLFEQCCDNNCCQYKCLDHALGVWDTGAGVKSPSPSLAWLLQVRISKEE